MLSRLLDVRSLAQENSFFLLGPRQTGKSTWLRAELPEAFYVDLLLHSTFHQLLTDPDSLEHLIRGTKAHIIIIDEIQKLPALLDVVHRLLFQNDALRFILTGSSARKLKHTGVNLLGGRAWERHLFPLLFAELKDIYTLDEAVQWGTLPSVTTKNKKRQHLESYISLYLEQEIQREGLIRQLGLFAHFLRIAAVCNSQQINFSALASDLACAEKTIANWFQILQDTLVGELLPCFSATHKRKPMSWKKFFFFDCGIANALLQRFSIKPTTPEYGVALENLVYTHLKAWCSYEDDGYNLFYWRSQDKIEVDFIVTHNNIPKYAIEVKSTDKYKSEFADNLNIFAEEFLDIKKIVVCRVPQKMITSDKIHIWPAKEFLEHKTIKDI